MRKGGGGEVVKNKRPPKRTATVRYPQRQILSIRQDHCRAVRCAHTVYTLYSPFPPPVDNKLLLLPLSDEMQVV